MLRSGGAAALPAGVAEDAAGGRAGDVAERRAYDGKGSAQRGSACPIRAAGAPRAAAGSDQSSDMLATWSSNRKGPLRKELMIVRASWRPSASAILSDHKAS